MTDGPNRTTNRYDGPEPLDDLVTGVAAMV
jgi:hypothetical protein